MDMTNIIATHILHALGIPGHNVVIQREAYMGGRMGNYCPVTHTVYISDRYYTHKYAMRYVFILAHELCHYSQQHGGKHTFSDFGDVNAEGMAIAYEMVHGGRYRTWAQENDVPYEDVLLMEAEANYFALWFCATTVGKGLIRDMARYL